jgi:hypothetical protein
MVLFRKLWLGYMGLKKVPYWISGLLTLEYVGVGRLQLHHDRATNFNIMFIAQVATSVPICLLGLRLSISIAFVFFLRSTLDLSNNVMEGRLPGFLSRLTRLQRLFLDNNHFSGELRVVYSRLERLVYVRSNLNAPWHAVRIEPEVFSTACHMTLVTRTPSRIQCDCQLPLLVQVSTT